MTGRNRTYRSLLILIVLAILPGSLSYAQEIFQTKGGEVTINLAYGNTTVQLQSDKLQVQLDYDHALLTAVLPLNTLINTAQGGRRVTPQAALDELTLTGKFGVDHIETSNHEPLQFQFSGMLANDHQEIPVAGVAELQHIGGGGDVSCLLGFSFTLDKTAIPPEFADGGELREIKVQVLQTILKRRK